MKQQYTKGFIKLWVSQMVTNNAFIQDRRITGDLVGAAAGGDLEALKNLLVVYANYIDQPIPPQAVNVFATDAPEQKQREMQSLLPAAERQSSIQEFIESIDSGDVEII